MSVFNQIGLVIVIARAVSCAPYEEVKNIGGYEPNFDDNLLNARRDCNCVCGENHRQMRVVGGNVSRVHEFPWLVGLSKSGEFYCGATVITRHHLLTAAHCVHNIDRRTISVAIGDHDRNDKERFSKIDVRRIKSITSHKLFDVSTYNNDIAVLELDHPVKFDSRIQPACLPDSGLSEYSGQLAVVAGWGRTGENDKTTNILRKVAVPVWKQNDCYSSGYGESRLSENMFCAGYADGGKDACQGDSGGPLQVKTQNGNMEVIGVVSWGRGCARPNLPGIYTKIANYIDWVQEALHGECMCPPPTHHPHRV